VTETLNATSIPERLSQGLTHSDPNVFIGVVIVDVSVTHSIDLQIDQTMTADLVKHMVEKRHAGADLTLAEAIQIEAHLHIGFTGDPMDVSLTCHHKRSSFLIVPHIPLTQ
jgi:hypothetical protein